MKMRVGEMERGGLAGDEEISTLVVRHSEWRGLGHGLFDE